MPISHEIEYLLVQILNHIFDKIMIPALSKQEMIKRKVMIPALPIFNKLQGNPTEELLFELANNEKEYKMAKTFYEQVCVLCNFLRNGPVLVSYKKIGNIFGRKKQTIFNV